MKNVETKPSRVQLDWSRLLGFDQADAGAGGASDRRLRLARVGTKIGGKPGLKIRQRA